MSAQKTKHPEDAEQSFEQMMELSKDLLDFIEEKKRGETYFNSSVAGALLLCATVYNKMSGSNMSVAETATTLEPVFDEIITFKKYLQ
jgi:hypothetical protein